MKASSVGVVPDYISVFRLFLVAVNEFAFFISPNYVLNNWFANYGPLRIWSCKNTQTLNRIYYVNHFNFQWILLKLYFFIGQNSNSFSFAKILHFCRTIMPSLVTILMEVYEPYMDRGGRPKQSKYLQYIQPCIETLQ